MIRITAILNKHIGSSKIGKRTGFTASYVRRSIRKSIKEFKIEKKNNLVILEKYADFETARIKQQAIYEGHNKVFTRIHKENNEYWILGYLQNSYISYVDTYGPTDAASCQMIAELSELARMSRRNKFIKDFTAKKKCLYSFFKRFNDFNLYKFKDREACIGDYLQLHTA